MSKTQQPDDPAPSPSRSTVILMLRTLADTTWRMFVPPFASLGFGYWVDVQYHSAPWAALGSVVVGIGVSAWLIATQIKKVRT